MLQRHHHPELSLVSLTRLALPLPSEGLRHPFWVPRQRGCQWTLPPRRQGSLLVTPSLQPAQRLACRARCPRVHSGRIAPRRQMLVHRGEDGGCSPPRLPEKASACCDVSLALCHKRGLHGDPASWERDTEAHFSHSFRPGARPLSAELRRAPAALRVTLTPAFSFMCFGACLSLNRSMIIYTWQQSTRRKLIQCVCAGPPPADPGLPQASARHTAAPGALSL